VALDGASRHLSFAGLDVLEANAQTSLTFRQPAQADPVTFTSIQPFVEIGSDLWLDSSNQFPIGSLASHFAQLFSTITAPLMGFYGPLSLGPHLIMKVAVSLATPLSPQNPPFYTVMPITLVLDYTFRPGFDDRTDCMILPDPGLSCQTGQCYRRLYCRKRRARRRRALYSGHHHLQSNRRGKISGNQRTKIVIPVSNIN